MTGQMKLWLLLSFTHPGARTKGVTVNDHTENLACAQNFDFKTD